MMNYEVSQIRRAIAMLEMLVNEPQATESLRQNPIAKFAREHLERDQTRDVSCTELWKFYNEIAAAGELPPLRGNDFFRRLPNVLAAVYRVRKSHNVIRDGRRVRGFRGITISLPELFMEAEPEISIEPESLPGSKID